MVLRLVGSLSTSLKVLAAGYHRILAEVRGVTLPAVPSTTPRQRVHSILPQLAQVTALLAPEEHTLVRK